MRRNRVRARKKRLICNRCGGKGHPARLCLSGDDCQDVDEVGTDRPVILTVIFFVWIGVMTPQRPSTQ